MTGTSVPAFELAFGGVVVDPELAILVTDLTVTHETGSFDYFEVNVRNEYPELPFTHGGTRFASVRDKVQIRMGYVDDLQTVFDGEVTRVGASFGEAPAISVAGHSLMHRLRAATRTQTFQGMSDGEVARQIASACELSPGRIGTGFTHAYLMQANQTDYDFLRRLARRAGFVMIVDGAVFDFDEPAADGPAVRLTWAAPAEARARLRRFDVTFDATAAARAVVVRATNPAVTEPIVSTATAPSAGAASASKTITVVDRPVESASEAQAIASSELAALQARSVTGTGACLGNPMIRAGRRVDLEGLGDPFNGRYRVTESTHRFDQRGFETTFTVNGEGRG